MDKKLKSSSQRIQNILNENQLVAKVIEFNDTTRTAQEAAETIGCQVGQIAKTLIFRSRVTQKPICVIASGKNRVDEKKIAKLVGEKIEKPDADFVLQHTSFAIGGIPPIGYTFEVPPIVDEDLMVYSDIWAAAGTPNSVFNLTPSDLIRITHGTIVNVQKG